MSGKAYTMKEMKLIVDYLVEHKAYTEIKGRKMWMDFESSKITNRTWQSLKETFLKRILPDIHNPHYKLSMHQISSFRQGCDMEERLKNKLEIREVNEAPLPNAKKKTDEQASSSKNKSEKGEDSKNSKVDIRDSTETLVLDHYETSEDVQRDLTSPAPPKDASKTHLRDLIEFEPMTPMAQAQKILDEFATDDEGSDREPRMEIDLSDHDKNATNVNDVPPIEVSDNEENNLIIDTNGDGRKDSDKNHESSSHKQDSSSKNLKELNKITETKSSFVPNKDKNKSDNSVLNSDSTKNNKTKINTSVADDSETNLPNPSMDTDSLLPNNQEYFNKSPEKSQKRSLSLRNKKLDSSSSLLSQNNLLQKSQTVEQNSDAGIFSDNLLTNKESLAKAKKYITDEKNTIENPCLKSVSLYEAQLNEAKVSDTDTSKDTSNNKHQEQAQPDTSTKSTSKLNEVVILKSHSESVTSNSEGCSKASSVRPSVAKRYREKALANVFGFSRGAVQRRRKSSYRRRSNSHQKTFEVSSGSSEWTSDTGMEYISPPRGRRNRQTRKYLKPKGARILSLEKNGGLFVVNNNKIYPLTKDGKVVKNYVTYISDNESEEDSKHWKLKYLEEKKKTAELQKLLSQIQEVKQTEMVKVLDPPTCSAKCHSTATHIQPHGSLVQTHETKEVVHEEKPVKIKFTKNNEEVQLEGPLSHITPALAQVMEILQKGPDVGRRSERSSTTNEPPKAASGLSTPLVAVSLHDEVEEKVNKLEEEIFKEIEEKDKLENNNASEEAYNNVTKRTRYKSPVMVAPKSPAKRARLEQEEIQKEEKSKTSSEIENGTETKKRKTRTPKKNVIENVEKSETTTNVRRLMPKRNVDKSSEVQVDAVDDSGVRYKFPSPPPTVKKAQTNKTTKKLQQKNFNRYMTRSATLSLAKGQSTEAIHNQDSEENLNLAASDSKMQIRTDVDQNDSTSESSNSYHNALLQSVTFHNSTLSSEVYRSDSFQLLMPINIDNPKRNHNAYSKVKEVDYKQYHNKEYSLKTQNKLEDRMTPCLSDIQEQDVYSSSNTSVPTSPVLSIVESLSINKSILTSFDDSPIVEHAEEEQLKNNQITLNQLMTSDHDVPMPLMEREFRINADGNDGINYHYSINFHNTPTSQSLVNKLNTVVIEDKTLTDSVNNKFKNLLLDSNKKSTSKNLIEDEQKKAVGKTRKRSSTPKKRESSRSVRNLNKEPAIEEEHMEACSRVTRRSCPPILHNNELIEKNVIHNGLNNNEKPSKKSRERKKKDIIKIKITRPKDKANKREKRLKSVECTSIQTDFGNELASIISEPNSSIDLIHNHSETCLQANECIGDSVEIVESSNNSIMTLNSSVENENHKCHVPLLNIDENVAQELYTNNAQDGIELHTESVMFDAIEIEGPTVFHTAQASPSSANSLLTEDLSIEIPEKTTSRSTKWYLFSEDENTNTNYIDINHNEAKEISCGSNLNYIFPVTCAIPDLSTITELSKENDADTRSNLASPLLTS